jgi:Protein of unknown function (DUF1254)
VTTRGRERALAEPVELSPPASTKGETDEQDDMSDFPVHVENPAVAENASSTRTILSSSNGGETMRLRTLRVLAACTLLAAPGLAAAQPVSAVPPAITTPDKVDSRIGQLDFEDGAPSVETAQKVYDTLDFTSGLNVFNNSFRGASAYGIRKGLLSIGADDNTVVIFSDLMDAKSLFLTANADTVYYMAVVDLTKGPMVVEQPPMGLGTINDMWFSWIIDIGFPGPDRGEGGNTCSCRRGMTARFRTVVFT